jgi:outer membrane protein TolC
MKKTRRILILAAVLAAFVPPAQPVPQEKPLSLTLEECIARAVKHNLGVVAQVYNSDYYDLAVSASREKFFPTLSFDAGKQDQNSASYSWIDSSDLVTTKYMNYSGSLGQAVPFGGSFSISLAGYKNESNARFQTINPRYGNTLSFSFSQPLLKDFGWGISRKDIIIARNNRDIAENDLKKLLIDTISSVEQAYWNLVLFNETLKVQRQSLKLAEDLLENNRKKAKIGTLAPKEVFSAEAEVARVRADILQATLQVKNQIDTLKGLLNVSLEQDVGEILPTDTPAFVKREVSLEEALALGLKNRPDLQSADLQVKNKETAYTFAKNQTLPALNLNAGYWSPGISGNQILYLDGNPLTGIIVQTVPRGPSLAMKDALNFKYNNWSVSLSLDIPLSSVFSRAAQAEAKVNLDQQIALMKQTEQRAYLEIRAAARAVQTNFERVNARKTARELAEQTLEAEQAKLEAGMSTSFVVLNYQRDVASARTSELQALIDYTLSLSQLDKATGTILEKRNIKLTDAGEVQK